MIENGDAVLTDDGGFKVNPDYYKELPRGDRHVETMTEVQAVEVMSALTAAGWHTPLPLRVRIRSALLFQSRMFLC